MESGGVIAEASWSSFDLPLDPEESELMAQLLGTFPSHGEEDPQELPWSDRPSNPCYYQCNAHSSASSNGPSSLIVPSEYEGCYLNDSNEAMGISSYTALLDLNMVQEQGATQFLDVVPNPSLNFCGTWNKRKHSEEGDIDGQTKGRKCARKDRLKQAKKATPSEDEDGSVAVANAQSSSCCTSDNDSNASQESPSVANTNGKTRASRRTATAPQSLYARKRRERINERLRILQNLVPNGTKVDLSTMLEEAVHYVKFLQLQIKLLSSDEMWMYAPIAYNGMNVGIDLNISQQ